MIVLIDSTGTQLTTVSTTPLVYTGLTISSGLKNSALLAIIQSSSQDATGLGTVTATWDNGGTNQLMTQIIAAVNPTSFDGARFFGLLNPTPGNKTLNIAYTSSTPVGICICAVSLQNVIQTSVAAAFINAANSISSPSITVNSTGGGGLVYAALSVDVTPSAPNGTQDYNVTSTDHFALQHTVGGGNKTLSWTAAGSNPSIVGVDIVAAPTPPFIFFGAGNNPGSFIAIQ